MRFLIKKIIPLFLAIILLCIGSYGKANKTEDDRIETLLILKIIDDKENLDSAVTREMFSKMIVKSTEKKDEIVGVSLESVCNDVDNSNIYASYIKAVLEDGHMFTYIDGSFKPKEYVTYSDLARASLSLLSYTNDDFRGNQVKGRNLKFESLGLNENINKTANDVLTKRDIINGIYNVLKENIKNTDEIYGLKVFPKLIIDSDKELNPYELKERKVTGPYIVDKNFNIEIPFDINKKNVFLNGVKSNIDTVKYDIENFGYSIIYLDLDNKYVYAYTEREDIEAPIRVKKGYISEINYSAKNMLVPYSVEIDLNKYMIESEDMKFAFSPRGTFKKDDYVIYLCNKMNDVNKAHLDEDGNVVHSDEDVNVYKGSIINVFKYDIIKNIN